MSRWPSRPSRLSVRVSVMLPVVLSALTGCSPATLEPQPVSALTAAQAAGYPSTPVAAATSASPVATPSRSVVATPTTRRTAAAHPLAGKVIVLDPGHNGRNGAHPEVISKLVDIGNGRKTCDTTGTQTNAGYAEHAFTWDLTNRLAAVLRARGATVILTRRSDAGVGPCITERAAIGNRNHADVALSVHADGGPATGHGFHVIAPARVGGNAPIVAPSRRLADQVRAAMRRAGEPYATYTGGRTGLTVRSDLGGLNLSRVPKVFVECANMRHRTDAAHLSSVAWRQRIALALADALTAHLLAEAGR